MNAAQDIPAEELPYWMRQGLRGVDWGVILAAAFSLLLAWPFILQAGLPHTNASENYVYRTADYAQAIQEGRLYPRWSPHVFGGYGAPIAHYYPPGAPYIAALVDVLFTGDPVTAVRIVYIAALGLSGPMVYVFITRRAGSTAGLLAAVIYNTSPYVVMTAPHILGDLPGTLALALLPTLLWATDRLLILNRPHDMGLVALTFAALVLTSPHDAVCGLALASLLLGWQVWVHDRNAPWHLVAAAFLIGTGLSAFFWLPAMLEFGAVQWRAPANPSSLRLSLETLFAPLRPIDLVEMRPAPQLTLGLTGLGATVLGVMGAGLARKKAGFQWLFLIAGGVLVVIALTNTPAEVWLVGPITLCVAIGSSALLFLDRHVPIQARRLLLPVLLVIVLVASLPAWLAPRWLDVFGNTDPQAQILYEQQNQGIAVLPPQLPVPATVSESLPPNRSLLEGYLSGDINKIAVGQLAANIRVGVLEHRTHSDRFQVSLRIPTTFNILTAYFPGWQATIGGRPTPLSADEQTGLIRVDVPVAINEEMAVFLGPTPIRTGAWAITWASLWMILIVTAVRLRRKTGIHDDLILLTTPESRLIAVVLGCFGLIILLFAAPSAPLNLYARPGYRLDNSYSLGSRTDVGLEAIAYRLDRFDYHPGESVDLTLYWQTSRPLTEDYQFQIYLLSAEGIHWLPSPLMRPGGFSTLRWLTNRYVRDEHRVPLSLTVAPGIYQIAIEGYACTATCANAISFFDSSGRLLGNTLLLPSPISILP